MSISLYLKFFYFLTLTLFFWNWENKISFTDKHTCHFCSIHNNLSDTIGTIIPDDYPITNKMLEKHFYIDGQQYSEEFVWFTNDTLNQTLIFELYTDYHRLSITHIFNNDIPNALHKSVLQATETFNKAVKTNSIESRIKSADRINSSYFTSNKKIRLGEIKQKIIKICLTFVNNFIP